MTEIYGAELRRLRRESGLSQRALADQLGVGFPHISKIERGREEPSMSFIISAWDAVGGVLLDLITSSDRCPHCGGKPDKAYTQPTEETA